MSAEKISQELFLSMVKSAGLPTTTKEIQAEWLKINVEEGTPITNSSSFSPFWRLITAIATKPCFWLVNLLVNHALPNTFLRFATGIYLDVYAWGVGVVRKAGATATGKITFTRASNAGELKIPKGTMVESPAIDGHIYRMITDGEAIIPDGAISVDVDATAESEGEAYNLGAGYFSILPTPVAGIVDVTTKDGWLVSVGADVEKDEALRLRARNQFSAVGQLHHDAAYASMISAFSGIRMDYLFFEKDAPRGAGTANCHIMLESGVPPQEMVDSINQYVMSSGNHGHGDDLRCLPICTLPITLDVTIYAVLSAGAERKAKLLQDSEDIIRAAFRQNTNFAVTKVMPLSRFSFSRLGEEMHAKLPELKSVEFGRSEDLVALLFLPQLESLSVHIGEAS